MQISMRVIIRVQWEHGREGVKKGIKGDKWGIINGAAVHMI